MRVSNGRNWHFCTLVTRKYVTDPVVEDTFVLVHLPVPSGQIWDTPPPHRTFWREWNICRSVLKTGNGCKCSVIVIIIGAGGGGGGMWGGGEHLITECQIPVSDSLSYILESFLMCQEKLSCVIGSLFLLGLLC